MLSRMPSISFGKELSTPVGQIIERATSALLIGPDWSTNLELCDFINREPECAGDAVRALRRQLKSSETKVVFLALSAAEGCVKNCAVHMHSAMASKDFMADMATVATRAPKPGDPMGEDAQRKALELIQEWALAFQHRMPAFENTYSSLRAKGVRFPAPPADSAPIFTPQPSASSPSQPAGSPKADGDAEGDAELRKLESDLVVVVEKIKLCREMLPESPGIESDEVLAEIVGFLEACKPRVVELVEAGMNGVLSEETLGKCLAINDALIRTLEAEEKLCESAEAEVKGDIARSVAALEAACDASVEVLQREISEGMRAR